YRESRACGAHNASNNRVRLRVCAAASPSTGLDAAGVLRHACTSHALVLSRARGLDPDGDSGRAAAGACRAPPHTAVCAEWGVGRVEPDKAKPAEGGSSQACGGVPAFELACGRAHRVPLAAASPAART